jgi:predicted double-glycine peptidase
VPRVLSSLLVALSLALAAVSSAAAATAASQNTERASPPTLDVPYVPQSDALCGGAAAAMVFRYWGDAHAGVEPFAPLVDARAGGIADDVLVKAIADRGWQTLRIAGSIDVLRDQIGRKRPVIILLRDRGAFYHYLVVTGVDAHAVVAHDPAWGPSRRMSIEKLMQLWRPAQFWALVVLPSLDRANARAIATPPPAWPRDPSPVDRCDALLNQAVSRIHENGMTTADEEIGAVRAVCPDAAGPLRELAGVRFAQHRFREADDLASRAVARDATDAYAWGVLASSRFVQDDFAGALDAWNAIGQPRVDAVNIAGLEHARYQSVAEMLGLTPNTILTARAFERAARRLEELPDRVSSRIAFRPAEDGFAVVDVAIAEQDAVPRGPFEWGAAAAQAIVNREIDVDVPGFTGQGEVWSVDWRWWTHRPRAAFSYAAPRAGWLPGVWRVDGSWESQRYTLDRDSLSFADETRAHAGVSVGDWLTGNLRYRVAAGFDAWNGIRHTASIGGEVERRFGHDRIGVTADAAAYAPISTGPAFQSAGIRVDARTTSDTARWTVAGVGGANAASADAPFALWSGAGGGHARAPLLRAHPLLVDGAIDGALFGRTLTYANGEIQRWVEHASPLRVALAAFTDVARASDRLPGAVGAPAQIDVGVGVRVRVPGRAGTLRADFGHGLRDGANAFTIGWQY